MGLFPYVRILLVYFYLRVNKDAARVYICTYVCLSVRTWYGSIGVGEGLGHGTEVLGQKGGAGDLGRHVTAMMDGKGGIRGDEGGL